MMTHTWILTGLLILTGCADTTVRHWPTEAQLQSSQDYQTEDARLQSRQVELLEALVSILEPTEHQLGTAEFDETPEPMPDPVSSSGDTAEPDEPTSQPEPSSTAVDSEADMPAGAEPPVALHGDGVSQDLSDVVIQRWTASWCGPCRAWNQNERQKLEDAGAKIIDVDIDQNRREARRYDIESVPTFFIRTGSGGNYWSWRHTGYVSAEELADHAVNREAYESRKRAEWKEQQADKGESRAMTPPSKPLDATVRVKVRTGDIIHVSTGTIIRSDESGSLVLACEHAVQDATDESLTTVETLGKEIYPATVLEKDAESDVAFLWVKADGTILPVVQIAADNPEKGADVFSIGCSNGKQPTVMRCQVKEINFYDGPDNVVCSKRPDHGRSGGGLFNSRNELIGVCGGQFKERNEGLYTGVAAVRKLMSRLKIPASVTVAEAN